MTYFLMSEAFHEAGLREVPIRDLGLTIAGTPLEEILGAFDRELAAAGITRLRPRCYLSTEWGVPFETISVAIPFYLARPELAELHGERTGLIEGIDREDILRYLRHEMGHVVNYAYRLYDRRDWVKTFGSITRPYVEEYRPKPWNPRFVRHLPGWYAQKHPDEDWAETFAVWMTPGFDWRSEYRVWPKALAKLEFCDRLMGEIREQEPLVTAEEQDEEVGAIAYTMEHFYRKLEPRKAELPPGLDGALRAIFAELPRGEASEPASRLIHAVSRAVARSVFTWTGYFPEKTRALLHHLALRADALGLEAPTGHERTVIVALTAFTTSLAMNKIHRGRYMP
jgi:putative zinc-binding metallo-peptidase